jgi:hypothetical protein
LLAVLLEQLRAVVRPDQVAEVFKQLNDGKSLLRRPVSGMAKGMVSSDRVKGGLTILSP